MNAESIAAEVAQWPVNDRLKLIEQIWEGISAVDEAAFLTDAMRRNLDQRLEAYRNSPLAGSSWKEVEARLRGIAS